MGEPADISTLMAQALTAMRGGDTRTAFDVLNRVIDLAPTHAPALVLKARLLRQRGDYDAAASCLAQARPHAARHPQFASECGYLALSRGDARGAIDAFSTPGTSRAPR